MDPQENRNFQIRLTFGVRNINLMRTFQPRFVIRAEWSKCVHVHHRKGTAEGGIARSAVNEG